MGVHQHPRRGPRGPSVAPDGVAGDQRQPERQTGDAKAVVGAIDQLGFRPNRAAGALAGGPVNR